MHGVPGHDVRNGLGHVRVLAIGAARIIPQRVGAQLLPAGELRCGAVGRAACRILVVRKRHCQADLRRLLEHEPAGRPRALGVLDRYRGFIALVRHAEAGIVCGARKNHVIRRFSGIGYGGRIVIPPAKKPIGRLVHGAAVLKADGNEHVIPDAPLPRRAEVCHSEEDRPRIKAQVFQLEFRAGMTDSHTAVAAGGFML